MVEADKMFATNHDKPELQDAGTYTFGSRITIVEADKITPNQTSKMLEHERSETESRWWKLTRCLQQSTTNQSSKMMEPKRSEAGSLWWRLKR